MKENTHLGRGMKFPPQVNPVTGRFVLSEEEQSVKESIYLILMTRKGERMMRPAFGSRTSEYVFAETNLTMQTIMAQELEKDIARNEPRVQEVEVRMDGSGGQDSLLIQIQYTVSGKSTPENMVFPFYLGKEPEKVSAEYETVEDDPVR